MKLLSLLPLVLLLAACTTTAPQLPPEPVPVPPSSVAEEVTGNVRVTAAKLNVRAEPSVESAIVGSLRRGDRVGLIRAEDGWSRVRLTNGVDGWVSAKHVRREKACPADRDFRMVEPPEITFTDTASHGVVTVEVEVSPVGKIVRTKVTSNSTGEPVLASIAEKEIRSAKFAAPIKDCKPQRFIYVYRKNF